VVIASVVGFVVGGLVDPVVVGGFVVGTVVVGGGAVVGVTVV
jgi:hypothetical protein